MVKRKKGQIQTLETIAVLFVFFVLLMLGVVFYIGYSRGRADIRLVEFHQAQSVQIAERVIDLAELQDTRQGVSTVNCFDALKVRALGEVLSEDEGLRFGLYNDKFGNSLIVLHQIYPKTADFVIYNNTNPDFRYSFPFFIPKCVYDPLKGHNGYGVGLLEVNYYAKQ